MGIVLRRTRLESSHTLVSLSEQCGVTYQQLQKYESGVNRVSISRLFVLSGALGASPTELIAEVQELIEAEKGDDVDSAWDHLQCERPEYYRRIISGLAAIDNREVLMSVVNLLDVLDKGAGRVER